MLPRVREGGIKDYLSKLDTNNLMRPDGMSLRVLWEPADAPVTHSVLSSNYHGVSERGFWWKVNNG